MFTFHLSEKTVRQLLRDPQLPQVPTFQDIREALSRLEAQEAQSLAELEHSIAKRVK